MAIRKQSARVQHHRLTDGGASFTVPSTDSSIDNWLPTDLALGEIGINLGNNTAYYRTTSGIHEFLTSGVWEAGNPVDGVVNLLESNINVGSNTWGSGNNTITMMLGNNNDVSSFSLSALLIGSNNVNMRPVETLIVGDSHDGIHGSPALPSAVNNSIIFGNAQDLNGDVNESIIGGNGNFIGSGFGNNAVFGLTGIVHGGNNVQGGDTNTIGTSGSPVNNNAVFGSNNESHADGNLISGDTNISNAGNSAVSGSTNTVNGGSNLVSGSGNAINSTNAVVSGNSNIINSGDNVTVFGSQNTVQADLVVVTGDRATAKHRGEVAHGAGFIGSSTTQVGTLVLTANSNDVNPEEAYLMSQPGQRFDIDENNAVYKFRLSAVATISMGGNMGDSAIFSASGCIKRVGGVTSLLSAVSVSNDDSDTTMSGASMTVAAQNTGPQDYLEVICTGVAMEQVIWNVRIDYEKIVLP